jgi:hypothetical protein
MGDTLWQIIHNCRKFRASGTSLHNGNVSLGKAIMSRYSGIVKTILPDAGGPFRDENVSK